jgi:hypothetical protein
MGLAAGVFVGTEGAWSGLVEATNAVDVRIEEPHVAVGAGGQVVFGTATATAVSGRLSAAVIDRGWSLGIEGRYDPPASALTSLGARTRIGLVGGSFVPCLRAHGMSACGVVLAARMSADASEDGGHASDAWFFVGIGPRAELHVSLPSNFALRFAGELLAHPVPHTLALGGRRMFATSAVSMSFGPSLVHAF